LQKQPAAETTNKGQIDKTETETAGGQVRRVLATKTEGRLIARKTEEDKAPEDHTNSSTKKKEKQEIEPSPHTTPRKVEQM
jgi:hypothetical protein